MPLEERDDYENIALLCPIWHTIIDKNPEEYPVQVIKKWKENHERRIIESFNTPKFETRLEVANAIQKLQIENKAIFDTYGPRSELARTKPLETEKIWEQNAIHNIIPNNRKIHALIVRNYSLLSDVEKNLFEKWKIHKDGFEYNKLSGDKNASAIFYPTEFKNFLSDGKT